MCDVFRCFYCEKYFNTDEIKYSFRNRHVICELCKKDLTDEKECDNVEEEEKK